MSCICYAALDGFYVRTLREQGVGGGDALAIAHEQRVLDACPQAMALGLTLGASTREAKVLLRGQGQLKDFQPEPYREAQTAFLDHLAQFSHRLEPGLPHEAWIDLSPHPNPATLLGDLFVPLQREGWNVRYGFGPSRWVAQLAAEVDGQAPPHAWSEVEHRLAELSVDLLLPVEATIRERLKLLGCRRIGEVAQMSMRRLARQFGLEAMRIAQASRGSLADPVSGIYPADAALARHECADGLVDALTLERVLSSLAKRLAARLLAGDQVGRRMRLEATGDSGKAYVQERTFTKTICDRRTAFRAMQLLLPEIHEPITAISVRLHPLEKPERRQRCLDGSVEVRARDLAQRHAFQAIRQVYGDTAIAKASELPTERRIQWLRAITDATGWR